MRIHQGFATQGYHSIKLYATNYKVKCCGRDMGRGPEKKNDREPLVYAIFRPIM